MTTERMTGRPVRVELLVRETGYATAPLGIGTLQLEDGTNVKGFVCEAVATEGAEDITHFGGWRAYIAAQTSSTRITTA